jgi:hypothetical protein
MSEKRLRKPVAVRSFRGELVTREQPVRITPGRTTTANFAF